MAKTTPPLEIIEVEIEVDMHIRGYEVAKIFLPQVVLLLDIELDTLISVKFQI